MVDMTNFYSFYIKALQISSLPKVLNIPYEKLRPLQAHQSCHCR